MNKESREEVFVMIERLDFVCPTIPEGGEFPLEHTGKGEDRSPEFFIKNLFYLYIILQFYIKLQVFFAEHLLFLVS